MKNFYSLIIGTVFISLINSCSNTIINQQNKSITPINTLEEVEIVNIPLSGEAAERKSEISGLCWFGDKLILLPQYPNRFNESDGKIFYIKKYQIEDFLKGKNRADIEPEYFTISLKDLEEYFGLGSGFEAITIISDTAYFSIESMNNGDTESYLIIGIIDTVNNKIDLIKSSIVKDPYGFSIHNISDESILLHDDHIIPIYEVFGKNVNTKPKVSVFDRNLKYKGEFVFPSIEYRITDVTSVDDSNRFWAINYFYPGDNDKLRPSVDSLLVQFGYGDSHLISDPVERLVQFEICKDSIKITKQPPIYLKLMEDNSRNWEGIAKFGENGFILATDTFPKTILAYIRVRP